MAQPRFEVDQRYDSKGNTIFTKLQPKGVHPFRQPGNTKA